MNDQHRDHNSRRAGLILAIASPVVALLSPFLAALLGAWLQPLENASLLILESLAVGLGVGGLTIMRRRCARHLDFSLAIVGIALGLALIGNQCSIGSQRRLRFWISVPARRAAWPGWIYSSGAILLLMVAECTIALLAVAATKRGSERTAILPALAISVGTLAIAGLDFVRFHDFGYQWRQPLLLAVALFFSVAFASGRWRRVGAVAVAISGITSVWLTEVALYHGWTVAPVRETEVAAYGARQYLAAVREKLQGLDANWQQKSFSRGPITEDLASHLPLVAAPGFKANSRGRLIQFAAAPAFGSNVTGIYRMVPQTYMIWYPGGKLKNAISGIELRPMRTRPDGRLPTQ